MAYLLNIACTPLLILRIHTEVPLIVLMPAISLSASTKTFLDPDKALRITGSLQLGLIGSLAMGAEVQTFIHYITPSNPPEGWEYQIRNDILLNYNLQVQKGLSLSKHFEWIIESKAQLGSLYTNYQIGTNIRMGKMTGFFNDLIPATVTTDQKFQFDINFGTAVKFVFYDATLQGGVFINGKNIYAIPRDQIESLVLHHFLGVTLNYGRHQLTIQQNFLSSEIKTGMSHKWVGLNYRFWF